YNFPGVKQQSCAKTISKIFAFQNFVIGAMTALLPKAFIRCYLCKRNRGKSQLRIQSHHGGAARDAEDVCQREALAAQGEQLRFDVGRNPSVAVSLGNY